MGWQRLVEMALYHTGPDISQLGSAWILDFVRMNALQPFLAEQVEEIRAGREYFTAGWAGCVSEGSDGKAVWKHSRRPEAALRLAKFLSHCSNKNLYPQFGLPVTTDGWKKAPFDEPQYEHFLRAMQTGRSFPTGQLWGMVEKRLTDLMGDIWNEVLANPERADMIVENQVSALAQRLRMTLKS